MPISPSRGADGNHVNSLTKKVAQEISWKRADIWHQLCFCEQTTVVAADAAVLREPRVQVRS